MVSDAQRAVLRVLYENKPTKMNSTEIAAKLGKNSGAVTSTLKSLASRDLVYQLDMQGRTTITPDGMGEL